MLTTLWARLQLWLAVAGAVVLAVGAALVYGFIKGRGAGKAKATEIITKAKIKAAQATIHAQEVRHDVEVDTSKLPDAPAQRVGEADPDTAAGELRDKGWIRRD